MMRRAPVWALALFAAAPAWAAAEKPLVAVVFGEHSFRQSPRGEGKGVRLVLGHVTAALGAAGVGHAELKDSDVEAGRLTPYKLAVFPYSFAWPETLVAAVEAYVKGGGKVVAFYTVPPRLAALVGAKRGAWESKEPRPRYASIRLRPDLVPGLPPGVVQNSHNVYPVESGAADAQVIGEWLDGAGKPLGRLLSAVAGVPPSLTRDRLFVRGRRRVASWPSLVAEGVRGSRPCRVAALRASWTPCRVPLAHLPGWVACGLFGRGTAAVYLTGACATG